MNKYVPQIIEVDLSYTTNNFLYENSVTCEVIKEDVFEHETTT
jgi:hypothetical protein